MFTAIGAFILGLLASPILLTIVVLALLAAEFADSNWRIVLFLWTIASLWVLFGTVLSAVSPWWLLLYLPIGFGWSLWRYRRYVQHVRRELWVGDGQPPVMDYSAVVAGGSSEKDLTTYTNSVKNRIALDRNVGRITLWIMLWPSSVACWTLHDVLEIIDRLVRVYLRKVYEYVAKSALESR